MAYKLKYSDYSTPLARLILRCGLGLLAPMDGRVQQGHKAPLVVFRRPSLLLQ